VPLVGPAPLLRLMPLVRPKAAAAARCRYRVIAGIRGYRTCGACPARLPAPPAYAGRKFASVPERDRN